MIQSWPGEDLLEHSVRVMKIGECVFKKEVELFDEELTRLTGVKGSWWRAAALLHDIGKAHRRYQNSLAKRPSFRCHEHYSAAYLYKSLRVPGPGAEAPKAVLALTVLLHHHAMERYDECRNLEPFDPAEELGGFIERVNSHLSGLRLEPIKLVNPTAAIKDVVETVQRRPQLYRLALIGVGPLVIADNLAAVGRGGGGRLLDEIKCEICHYITRSINCLMQPFQ